MGIILKDVYKIYEEDSNKEKIVLNKISLEIENGSLLAIKGKSGAGKSTLMHIIGCLDDMTKGEYLLDGTDISMFSKKRSQNSEIKSLVL